MTLSTKSVALAILFPARYFAFLTEPRAGRAAAMHLRGARTSVEDATERAA